DDEMLFLEFLHDLVLYDRIELNSSGCVPNEILEWFAKVNASANTELLNSNDVANPDRGEIAKATCRLIAEIAGDDQRLRAILNTRIPMTYKSEGHDDYERMAYVMTELGMDLQVVPFALVSYRELG